jgi:hypothetical protein
MKAELAQRWLAAFYAAVEDDAVLASQLRDASLASDLKAWTAALTVSVAADDQRVAYSLWKTLSVRASLRVVFCYRRDGGEAPALVSWLADQVVAPIPVVDRTRVEGTTLLTVGSRADAATFPYGFFQTWKLSSNTGRFERFTRS